MENFIEALRQSISEHSMDFALFVAGSLGALISDSGREVKLTKKQRVIRMAFGGVTAIFSTQLIVELLKAFTNIELSHTAGAGVGFYIGHIGVAGITKLMVKYSERKKK
jgi:hypothetical protein